MPKFTHIARISDGLPLAASMEDEKDHRELDQQKGQAKKIIRGLNSHSPAKMTVDSGSNQFQCVPARRQRIALCSGCSGCTRRALLSGALRACARLSIINEDGVCYLCLVERQYPKRCAEAALP